MRIHILFRKDAIPSIKSVTLKVNFIEMLILICCQNLKLCREREKKTMCKVGQTF